jgi:small-conductance mechanosensitive channel
MNDLAADLTRIESTLLSAAGAWQIAVLLAGLGIAWGLARAAKKQLPAQIEPGKWKVAAGSFARVVFPLLSFALVWLGKWALARFHDVTLLKLALPLLALFAAIRIAVYLIRHLIPPSPLLKASERAIVYLAWIVVALHFTGLLTELGNTLNEISFSAGKQNISLLMVLTGVLTVFITLLIAVTLSRVIESRIMRADTVNLSLRLVIAKLIHALAVVVAILIALPLVGIDVTVLSVFGGALGVGLGFGLQKVASNYVSGFIILLERSIRVGDLVTVDNRHGAVSAINARYTVLRSLDGTEALIPNETLITGTVVNHTYTDPVVALRVPVTVAYGADIDRAEALMLESAEAQSRVLGDPAPGVQVKNLGDNGIELELVVWLRDADMGQTNLKSDILRAIWRSFRQAGIEVPFPQRVVHIQSASG